MTRRTGISGPPSSYLSSGEWPDGEPSFDAPAAVAHCQEIARRLAAAMQPRTVTAVAEEAELARSTIHDIVTGRTWPDVVTLAKLEEVLNVRLWPDSNHD